MSTILKALRRLEEDHEPNAGEPARAGGSAPSSERVSASDPRAADELRERILAEESVPRDVDAGSGEVSSGRTAVLALVRDHGPVAATLFVLVLAIGVIGFALTTGDGDTPTAAEPIAGPSPVPAPREVGPGVEPVAPAPTARFGPESADSPDVVAVAVPAVPAVLSLSSERATSELAPPRPSTPDPESIVRSVPKAQPTAVMTAPVASAAERSPVLASTPTPVAASLAEARPRSASPVVQTVDRSRLPAVAILRTSWHPRSDRRSARLRIEETGEVLTLREGDAVGPLILKEISPSSVVFETEGVEISRRVGSGR